MCVMRRLIRTQCVQTWVRRSNTESSCGVKHIKVNLVPVREQANQPPGPNSDPESVRFGANQCLASDRAGALVANCSSWGLAGRLLWALA